MGEKEEYKMVSSNEGTGASGPTFTTSSKRRIYIVVGVICLIVLVVVAVALGIYFGVTRDDDRGYMPLPSESSHIKADSSFEIHLLLDTEYLDDFDDPATTVYQTLKDRIEILVDYIMKTNDLREWYIRNTVIGFRYGSATAVDKIDFKTRLGLTIVAEEILMEIKNGLRESTTEVEALHIRVDDTTIIETARTGIMYLGESCSEDNDCSDSNSQCASSSSSSSSSSSVCQCYEGYYDSNFENATRGRCLKLLSFEERPCRSPRDCLTPGAICQYHWCTCDSRTHVLNNEACEPLSEQPTFCPRSIPNEHAILGPDCIDDHSAMNCRVTCKPGYRLHSSDAESYRVSIYCSNGTWTTTKWDRERGFGVSNICLPEADFHLCQPTIPNGKLEASCGPETDWLCDFTCYDGYRLHPFMSGILRDIQNKREWYKLRCEQGVWKTGYEDIGLNVTEVCFPKERNCTQQIPNGKAYLPCPGGYSCSFECNPGFHLHVMAKAKDWPTCVNGVWQFHASKYDQTITPENVCIPNDKTSDCSSQIKNGRISNSSCTRDCYPDCNDGFYFPLYFPRLTCDNGTWLTKYYQYTGDNICFPNGGYVCPHEISNGTVGYPNSHLKDDGERGRHYYNYQCNKGYRRHRAIDHVECLLGGWITGLERFGIGVDDICTPFDAS